MRWLLSCVTVFISFSSPKVLALPSPTNSIQFQAIEDDDGMVRQFARDHNHLVNNRLSQDTNYHAIEKWLYQTYDVPMVRKHIAIDKTHALEVVDQGLGKPTELILRSALTNDVLFSTDQLKPNGSLHLSAINLSPDQHYVSLQLDINGSIDETLILIYDLKQRLLLNLRATAEESTTVWKNTDELLYYQRQTTGREFVVGLNLISGQTVSYGPGGLLGASAGFAMIWRDDLQKMLILDQLKRTSIEIKDPKVKELTGADADSVYFRTPGPNSQGEIRRVAKTQTEATAGDLFVPESPQSIFAAQVLGNSVLVSVRSGADRWLRVYGHDGKKTGEMLIPDYCSLASLTWLEPGVRLRARLVSTVQWSPLSPSFAAPSALSATEFVYNFTTSSWDRDPASIMLKAGDVSYKTEVVSVKSADGTVVPMRLTYRADLARDGHRSVLLYSYGGFALEGYLDPYFDPPVVEFMRHGGVVAAPGLRGGNEFGEPWHKAAVAKLKINTFNDLVASAQWLVSNGWTKPDQIISTGTSNGGLTVAASALLNPGVFGLVIPISGVLDMLGKERMDPTNKGWDEEYGSADDLDMDIFLQSISPIELASQQANTRFLTFVGLDDTRVNRAHSFKLQSTFDANWQKPAPHPTPVHLTAVTLGMGVSNAVTAAVAAPTGTATAAAAHAAAVGAGAAMGAEDIARAADARGAAAAAAAVTVTATAASTDPAPTLAPSPSAPPPPMPPPSFARAELYAIRNSGHWLSSESYQNLIGWRAQTVFWTTVYAQAGWVF